VRYYAERNNLLNDDFSLDLEDLRKYFYQTYRYFNEKDFFRVAFHGAIVDDYPKSYQVLAPTMAPSPEIFFMNHMRGTDVLPIFDNHNYFTESELFTLLEILYHHIGYYDFQKGKLIKEEPQREFATHTNNLLKWYKNGYFLEERHGFIMKEPNEALKELLQSEVPNSVGDEVLEQLRTAIRMYYRFDSNLDQKRNAIETLAHILEPIRYKLKDLLNSEYFINKDNHDKLIFDILNNFQIRHNREKQYTEYSKPIWYDWMMQYYSSVIITYYRLIQEHQD